MLASYFVNILSNLELYLTGFNKELIANSCAGTGRQKNQEEGDLARGYRGGWMDQSNTEK